MNLTCVFHGHDPAPSVAKLEFDQAWGGGGELVLVPRCPRCGAWRSPYTHRFTVSADTLLVLGEGPSRVVASQEKSGWWTWTVTLEKGRLEYGVADFKGPPPPSIEHLRILEGRDRYGHPRPE